MELSFEQHLRYRLAEETRIETGNSTFCQAQDTVYNRTVGVKIIPLQGNDRQRKEQVRKAQQEVQVLIELSELTTHVPLIYHTHVDEQQGLFYIFMQWIKGKTLEERMDQMLPRDFLECMIRLCQILEIMEKKQLFHQDIKPANVMLQGKEVFLIDFNLSLSTPNQVEGTPHYKAPEMDANSITASRRQVDIFSVGVILYRYFTKRLPVRGEDYGLRSRRRTTASPEWDYFTEPVTLVPELDPKINDVILRCMKLDPKQRYTGAGALRNALYQAERSIRYGATGKGNARGLPPGGGPAAGNQG